MKISSFSDKHSFLSNFAPSKIVWDGRVWRSVEHLYQARKTNNKEDQEKIRNAPSPGKAKRLGRKVSLLENWELIKYDVMLECLRLKFRNKLLASKLVETFPHDLIEGNHWHDNEWGKCNCSKCEGKQYKNMLGQALMQIRKEVAWTK